MKTKNPIKIAAIIALGGTIIVVSVHGCKDSKDYREYYNRGIARLEEGEHDHAISDFTRTIEMRPGFAMAHFYRGRTYFRKGDHDQAISDLNKAIELDPQLAVAYGERAVIYFIRKEYDKVWDFKPTRDFSSIFAKFQEEEDESGLANFNMAHEKDAVKAGESTESQAEAAFFLKAKEYCL